MTRFSPERYSARRYIGQFGLVWVLRNQYGEEYGGGMPFKSRNEALRKAKQLNELWAGSVEVSEFEARFMNDTRGD